MAKTTFAMYEIYGKQTGAKIIKTEDDQHNLEQFSKLYKEHGADVSFLCLPNNPLGECLAKKFKLESKNISIGSGSDQILEFAIHEKKKKKSKVLMAKTTFAM